MIRWSFMLLAVVLFSCNSANEEVKPEITANPTEEEYEKLSDKIVELEEIVDADVDRKEMKARKQLLIAYANFANNFHEDEKAPEYLFRGAKLANELGKPRRAIEYLTNLHDGYPSFDKRTEAAFLVGFIYENVLNDKELAQKAYEKVIEFYPDSKWAEEAKNSIQLLYLTDEEKIRKFQEQNKQQ